MCLAVPGEVKELVDKSGLRFAKVSFGGITREICMEYEPEARPGDFVLVHVGFAIARIDAEEAARAWEILQQLGGAEEFEAQQPAEDAEERHALPR